MPTLFKKKNRDGGFYPQWRFRYVNAEGKRVEGIGWTDAKKTRNHALDVESEARAIRTGQKAAPPARRDIAVAAEGQLTRFACKMAHGNFISAIPKASLDIARTQNSPYFGFTVRGANIRQPRFRRGLGQNESCGGIMLT